jgi:hypothetical protein
MAPSSSSTFSAPRCLLVCLIAIFVAFFKNNKRAARLQATGDVGAVFAMPAVADFESEAFLRPILADDVLLSQGLGYFPAFLNNNKNSFLKNALHSFLYMSRPVRVRAGRL